MECTVHKCAKDNALWGRALAGVLWRLGCSQAVACPGLRSTPITWNLAHAAGYTSVQCPAKKEPPEGIEVIPALDERSAAFFALGLAKKSHKPVALICTSGTAAANFLPAIAEAKHSHIPLFVITTDRPAELQQCGARQTLAQEGLYTSFVARSQTLPLPESIALTALRSTLVSLWQHCLQERTPVHLNIPMREPLLDPEAWKWALEVDLLDFWYNVEPPIISEPQAPQQALKELLISWKKQERGLIVVGPHCPDQPELFCKHVQKLSQTLDWPVLADALGPLRFRAHELIISKADTILKNKDAWEFLRPHTVLALGPPPVARSIRTFLETVPALRTWIWSPYAGMQDPLHRGANPLYTSLESLAHAAQDIPPHTAPSPFTQTWLDQEQETQKQLQPQETELLQEETLPCLLQKLLPTQTPLFVANSLSVRHFNTQINPTNAQWEPYCSRGVDGIDGTLSTALGIAHHNRPTVLISGDLGFLHDTNGLLLAPELHGSLTVLIVNNNGGKIFTTLPIGQLPYELLERYTLTPQCVDIQALARAYSISYKAPTSKQALQNELARTLSSPGLHLLEIRV